MKREYVLNLMTLGHGDVCGGSAGKPYGDRRAGNFLERSADLRRCEITNQRKYMSQKASLLCVLCGETRQFNY